MIKPKTFPKVRLVNLFKIGYTAYWHDWKHIKFNLTPKIEKSWSGQIIDIGWPGLTIQLDFRRGNFIDQIKADTIVRQLPKN